MAYNFPPGGGFPGQSFAPGFPPPGMGAPPGMGGVPGMGGAPGMSPPPGMPNSSANFPGRPGSIPASYQPPPNMPGINFNAPVIRMGVAQGGGKPAGQYGGYDDRRGGNDSMGGGNRGRMGLGADSRGNDYGGRSRENITPLTKEEVARTIFIGGLTEEMPEDQTIENVFNVASGLRRWTRGLDANGKACEFAFAEYEDAASLEVAIRLYKDLNLPMSKRGRAVLDSLGNLKELPVTVTVDEETVKYVNTWSKGNEDELQFKVDSAKDDLESFLTNLKANISANGIDGDGDLNMEGGQSDPQNAETINIPVSAEDELSDIPPEMRETVAAEIAAFRDRSNRRDMERLRKEEEQEAAERNRSRPNRLASPPIGGTNGIPIGPRDRTIQGAPSGPKGYRGPYDQPEVIRGEIKEEDEDSDLSDTENERRSHAQRDNEIDKRYFEQELRWLAKEKAHFSAVERQKREEEAASATMESHSAELADRLANFDDQYEMRKPTHLYYKDRKLWTRERRMFRGEEKRRDDKDRREEDREHAAQQRKYDTAKGMADDFLAQQAEEMSARHSRPPRTREPERTGFSLNLGNKTDRNYPRNIKHEDDEMEDVKSTTTTSRNKQTMADVEGLLDDEEDAAAGASTDRKPLRTLDFKPLAGGEKLTDLERRLAVKELAMSIPNDAEALFAQPVRWEHVTDGMIAEVIKPFLAKKIMESLGVQEDMLVEVIEGIIRRRGTPGEIVDELEGALDEEALALAKKVWRMLVFYSEQEYRGLGEA